MMKWGYRTASAHTDWLIVVDKIKNEAKATLKNKR